MPASALCAPGHCWPRASSSQAPLHSRQSYSRPGWLLRRLCGGPPAPAINNFGDGIRKRKAPRIEARGRRPGQKPCPGALIGRETVSRKVAAASPFEKIGEEAARIAARRPSFLISHKHGRDSTTVGRPSGTLCRGLSHKRCSEVGRSLHLRGHAVFTL